jgi:hypothetical protein
VVVGVCAVGVVFFLILSGSETIAGIRVCGVDEATYTAANEVALRSVPLYRGAFHKHVDSIGQDTACGLHENGPPFVRFSTWHSYWLPAGTDCDQVAAYYLKALHQRGWIHVAGIPTEAAYEHGSTSLVVNCFVERDQPILRLEGDHHRMGL